MSQRTNTTRLFPCWILKTELTLNIHLLKGVLNSPQLGQFSHRDVSAPLYNPERRSRSELTSPIFRSLRRRSSLIQDARSRLGEFKHKIGEKLIKELPSAQLYKTGSIDPTGSASSIDFPSGNGVKKSLGLRQHLVPPAGRRVQLIFRHL